MRRFVNFGEVRFAAFVSALENFAEALLRSLVRYFRTLVSSFANFGEALFSSEIW